MNSKSIGISFFFTIFIFSCLHAQTISLNSAESKDIAAFNERLSRMDLKDILRERIFTNQEIEKLALLQQANDDDLRRRTLYSRQLELIDAALHLRQKEAPQTFMSPRTHPTVDRLATVVQSGVIGGEVFDAAQKQSYQEPFGPLPSDNSGNGGPRMPTTGSQVLAPGAYRISLDLNAANYLTDLNSPRGTVIQKFENHNAVLELNHGLRIKDVPDIEVGIRVQAQERDSGFLNGFIMWAESHLPKFKENPDRFSSQAITGTVDKIKIGEHILKDESGCAPWQLGDVLLTLKTAVSKGNPIDLVPRITARLVANISTRGTFTSGNFIGGGFSVLQPLSRGLALHADTRVVVPTDKTDDLGLPLKTAAIGGTVGLEFRTGQNTSVGVQVNANESAYRPTGIAAFDAPTSDVSFGVTQLANIGTQQVLFQLYGREDFSIPAVDNAHMKSYDPPDFQAGLKISVPFNK